jgi:hypothetical protein
MLNQATTSDVFGGPPRTALFPLAPLPWTPAEGTFFRSWCGDHRPRAAEVHVHLTALIIMRTILALLAIGSLESAGFGAELVITSLTANGQLTWTNAATNASYRVEWAPTLTGPWQQFNTLTNLDSFKATGSVVTVTVPLFYRVVWTDPPPPQPAGDWEFNGYSFAGSLVVTGLISLTNSMSLNEASGSWVFGAVPNGTNTWQLRCPDGEARGSVWDDFRFSLFLDGCGFAEGVFGLEGALLGDTYSGTWFDEGIVANPIGTFIARKKSR